jgi:hypothetical protein
MRIRKSVFGSASERSLYKALATRWSDKLHIFPCLPFLNVVQIAASELPRNEWDYLLKTSVDYTLCDVSDQPLLSIEFDGLGEGFSRQGEYVPRWISSKDPNREWKLNLKLRLCEQVGYPLFVISYEEATPIGPGLNLAIVDGIIGRFLAHVNVVPRVNELLQEHEDIIADLPPHEAHDYVDDLLLDAEVEMDFTWNPISRKLAELQDIGYRRGMRGEGFRWLDDSGVPPADHFWRTGDVRDLKKRAEALNKANRIGCEATVETPEGPVTEVAWMRNISGVIWPGTIIEGIARLLAWKRALERFGGEESSL